MVDIMSDHSASYRADPARLGLSTLPRVRQVGTERPWVWLEAAWNDLRAAPQIAALYGIIAVVSSLMLTVGLSQSGLLYLLLPLAAGFMLLGPIFAVGLYEASRLIEQGERPTLTRIAFAYRRNTMQIAGIGMTLMLAMLAWIRVAFLIFALFFSTRPPAFDQLIDHLFFSAQTVPFLLTGTLVGGVIATIVFSISVVAIPMLLDRQTDIFTAMATSVSVVRANPKPMLLWAFLITLFTAAGIVTGFLGLALALPLIGHASWHCYRDLVEPEQDEPAGSAD